LESELKKASSARDQLGVQLKSEQQSSAEAAQQAARHAAEIKNRLEGVTAELKSVSAEAAKLRSDRERANSELTAARTSAQKLEAEKTAAAKCVVHLERELEKACHARDQLRVQLQSEQESLARAAQQAVTLNNRLDGLTAEVDLINLEAAQLRSDRERADCEWNEQLGAAKAFATELNAALAEATELNHRFESDVASLRQDREELETKLFATQLRAVESESRVSDLELRLKKMAEEVERLARENAKYKSNHSIDPKVLRAEAYTFKTSAEKPGRRKSSGSKKRP
jgi:chromosome segregation ATPase